LRRALVPIGAAVLVIALAMAFASRGSGTPTLQERVQDIASGLRCPVCQNLSVADSPSQLAGEMRSEIATRLRAGASAEEIDAYFVQRYGDWVLLAPPARGLNLLLWLAPFGAVAAGIVVVAALAHRWRRPPAGERPAVPPVDDADRRRLAAELERLGD
jgi:cytochrome c-type biogenesis protein CcmH